ncbi:D-alanine--D-alanine ligase family protein [Acidipropionibacterium jensenii]|uniref:D-alanine--D-alanine ligase family protein n=1 Tax=Acidipropionibacterium jensenii TaxID=1749 RepID=UPI0026474547|nr:D-alanine--D-alanine ligase family protein [Acidipropionibacterium jensenii]MDN5977886.1 D-alanine--D-alanine ligase [Acidipropionibacterium jensenii]MDN5996856.1 D-alanine--D-alanine ligase [Acidipropionibacterium jensenii]MDN6426366.1 D-alanine--D-alanine ligase [Acidipropionibacterium jensenii]MDN6440735.1 D-alanine--D-alanine ligase [Acidipropionibacterium jensenii]MDN6480108.1 D-alanine--D-alanine ligase [Acidipropionibacterium jensenii]
MTDAVHHAASTTEADPGKGPQADARPDGGSGEGGRIRVALVFGGVSSEHSISCLTAANVLAAMDPERFQAIGIGITADGTWTRWSTEEIGALPDQGELPEVTAGHPLTGLKHLDGGCFLVDNDGARAPEPIDVVFPLLHGPFGEDGTIQGLFEMTGVRYVGCGVAASANCMDKHLTKVVLSQAGIPVGPYEEILPHDWLADRQGCLDRIQNLRYPLFVKPARGGSSVGISRVASPDGVVEAVEAARRWDPKVIVEQGLVGREIECSVLDGHHGEPPRASLPGEIIVHDPDGFYDFDAKYLTADSLATVAVPADLDQDTSDKVRRTAVRAFQVLGCEGLARIDCFVTPEGEVLVNEPNTLPGFTRTSGYPLMWKASGLDYRQLVTELLELALERPLGLR